MLRGWLLCKQLPAPHQEARTPSVTAGTFIGGNLGAGQSETGDLWG